MTRRPYIAALIVILAALVMTGSRARAADAPSIREFDIPTLEKLGQDIYQQDQLAWKATDALRARVKDLRAEGIRGWIVNGNRVRFIRQRGDEIEAAYDIDFREGEEPRVSRSADASLSPEERAQFKARELAGADLDRPCSKNYNSVVLRDPNGHDWLVWLLAATTDPKVVMVGGHYRFTISEDGGKVLSRDALSRSCLVLTKADNAVALATTQLVSDTPVETFVFLNLQHRIPFFVITPNKKMWKIENGHISLDKGQ
jgi:hypothetical protein